MKYIRSHHNALLFFFNVPATTEIYTLSLHDALPIFVVTEESGRAPLSIPIWYRYEPGGAVHFITDDKDRKSTRLNSSHVSISYAVFCLKKKKHIDTPS